MGLSAQEDAARKYQEISEDVSGVVGFQGELTGISGMQGSGGNLCNT
jgi:hypothetical protein